MKNNKVQTNKISLIVTIMIFIFSYQLSYAQHSITINKIDQSDCYSTGDIIEIYGTGFGKPTNNKTLVIRIGQKDHPIDKIRTWAPKKISAVIPNLNTMNKNVNSLIGILIDSKWASNRNTKIVLCAQNKPLTTKTVGAPTKQSIDRGALQSPITRTLNDNLPIEPRSQTKNYTSTPKTISAETQQAITPRRSGSLSSLGTPPKIELDTTTNKENKEQREAKEIIVISASMDDAIALAELIKPNNIRIKRRTRYSNLGAVISILGIPDSEDTADILKQLREYDPNLWIDFNHRYQLLSASENNPKQWAYHKINWTQSHQQCGEDLNIGIIDTGISSDASIAPSRIIEKSFLPNGVKSANKDHGTAISSLLLGSHKMNIIGLIPKATLYSAAIFREVGKKNNSTSDTTAEFILSALDWLAGKNIKIINMSLGGPRNLLVELAITTLNKRGFTIVSAAGVDKRGKPLYPAAQDEAIAVRAIDINGNVFSEKIQGQYIDFSAPGVDLWLLNAKGKGKYLSGSSFASPFVAASYLLLNKNNKNDDSLNRIKSLKGGAQDLGVTGKDRLFGYGLISLPNNC